VGPALTAPTKTGVNEMSQHNVEQVIGRLVTDEAFRHRFVKDPEAAMQSLAERGVELTPCEQQALRSVDPRMLAFFADTLNPCLQKSDLRGGLK
jgi:hypothetical protein